MENKIEIYQLMKFAPYRIKLQYTHTGVIKELESLHNVRDYDDIKVTIGWEDSEHIWMYKPLLKPLSDLTISDKDGITDIERLAKIAYPKAEKNIHMEDYNCFIDILKNYRFYYNKTEYSFYCIYCEDRECYVPNQLQLFEFLFEHHYDVYNWIENDLAVNINKLTF